MAATKTQQGMVFLKEGATAPAAAPAADHPPGYFVPLRPGQGSESETDQSSWVSSEEAVHNMYPAKESSIRTGGLKRPTNLNTHSDNLSPDITRKGVRVTLDNNSMWKEFFSCKTEMILTKEGSRMFPYCRFRISGLQPATKYCLIMDVQPLDLTQYKWTGESWQVSRKAECHIKSQPFAHPESPATGQHWMQNPVSFYRLKLTNNISDQDGNIILHPMHRYLPRLHLVQTDKAVEDLALNDPSVLTFCFPQTEFLAVTAYQNPQFAQLKVNYNPFAKGLREDGSNSWSLKLKAASTKQLNKDEGRRITEQHPVRKNLKSLLASHKPRSSKAGDSKCAVPKDLQNNSTVNNNQSAAKNPGESLRSNSRPAQKLFSELIREAHVSLQRCSVEQLGINHSTSLRGAQTNTRTTTTTEDKEENVVKKDISVEAPMRKREAVEMKKKMKDDRYHLNSPKANIKTDFTAASSKPHNSFELSDNQCHSDSPSDAGKQHKRPARLPLPALALFLKRHSVKSKKTESKPDPPTPAPPSEAISDSRSSAATSDKTFVAKRIIQDCRLAHTDLHPNGMVLNVAERTDDTTQPPSSPSCLGTVAGTDSVGPETDDPFVSTPESSGLEPTVPDGAPVLPNSDRPFCTFGTSTSTLSTCATSNASSNLSPLLNTVLLDANSPETPTESSALPSDSGTLRTESSLPDPECSSFDFEPLSPASSPEPLPPLPASLALELDTSALEATSSVGPPEDLLLNKNSSVFQWHTVLPPSESDRDSSFTAFQPTPEAPPLLSVTPPLLPCQSEPQSLNTSTSMPHGDPTVSFQESEQLLPFSAELSPLALQLTLSPTFSSLGEDELSPTPSLSDFVHFFSTDVETGMGGAFSNTMAAPCPAPSMAEAPQPSPQVLPDSASKPCKRKKTKLSRFGMDQKMDDYRSIQPNLEEVDEQLFISFTSKEALKMHITDSSEGLVQETETTPESQQTTEEQENSNRAESLEETVAALENTLLRDLKLMKYRQVIHPVLQEVGLKMTLLDPALSIDLQYLGVHLPIPPPGVGVEPLARTLPSPPGNALGVSSAFVSRTGKTTDVTQIKGWREKFTLSEAVPTPASCRPEGGPSSDPQKKNLSAFCSDMLDEYLENEGKLIDERAASFSQPTFETPVYELPVKSTSYVWTPDNILKKQTADPPASDLISGFIPPSKRPRLKETKMCRRAEKKHKARKQNKPRPEVDSDTAAATVSESSPTVPKQSSLQTTVVPHRTIQPSVQPTFKKKKKLKPRTLSQTLSSPRLMLDDLAPLESDSELGQTSGQDACKRAGRPTMTRGLLRQRALEDGVVWEGRCRTSITEERATVALTSLFTLTGFVSENPTAPIQLAQAQASPCLNEFCRLGCICSSLSHSSRNSHCGRPPCMFGCTCLKQKVVLLKNLDSSDSSPTSHYGHIKKRKRMKMAYVLKEADSVSQPADRIQILWKRDGVDSDPEPVHIPDVALPFGPTGGRENHSSCARVRGYRGWIQKHKEAPKGESLGNRGKAARLKFLKQKDRTLKETKVNISSPHLDEAVQPLPSKVPPSPPKEPTPKPSKRLFILADCRWESDTDQSYVLKKLCEAMAQDQLDQPFWIRKYLISPIDQTVEGSGANRCIQYRIRISTSKLQRENPKTVKLSRKQRDIKAQKRQDRLRRTTVEEEPAQDRLKDVEMAASLEDWQKEMMEEAEPLEDWQKEMMEEAEPLEDWQKEMMEEAEPLEDWQKEMMEEAEPLEDLQKEMMKEAEPLEDWQKEVEEGDIEQEEESCTGYQGDDGQKRSGEEMKSLKKRKGSVALPFLAGVSAAGFLSADKKQPGGTDHMIQVNGKLYPLAKIQLGRMGALHPANRLAAYLTGRVGSNRQREASPPSLLSSGKPAQSSERTPQTTSSASSVLSSFTAATTPVSPEPSVTPLIPTTSPTGSQPSSSVGQPVHPSLGSAPHKGSQVLLFQVPGSRKTDPISPNPPQIPAPPSTRQKIVLQVVRSASGMQYYRKPDGRFVQLIPISQLRPVNSKPSIQRGPPSPSLSSSTVPCTSGFQAPAVTVVNGQQLPLTSSSSSPSSGSSPSSLCSSVSKYLLSSSIPSSSSSVSVPHVAVPLHQGSVSLAKKGTWTLKIPSANTDSDPVRSYTQPPTLFTTAPGSVNLVSLKPSTTRGSELGGETATVNAASLGTEAMGVQPQIYPTSLVPTETPIPRGLPPPASNLPADMLSHDEELALDPVDLDIICVDDETGLPTETQEVVNLMSSSDTENSSDFRESEGEEKQPIITRNRHLHNVHEKNRRVQLRQKFSALMREVVQTGEKMSRICTLQRAVKMIQELRWTDRALRRKTRRLRRRRDEYLSVLAPSAAEQTSGDVMDLPDEMEKFIQVSSNEETVTDTESTWTTSTNGAASAGELTAASQLSSCQAGQEEETRAGPLKKLEEAPRRPERVMSSSDVKDEVEALSSAMNTTNPSKAPLLDQAPPEIQTLQRELESLKTPLDHIEMPEPLSNISGKSQKKFQHLSSKPRANRPRARGAASTSPPTEDSEDDIGSTSFHLQRRLRTPPTCDLGRPTPAVQLQPRSQSAPQVEKAHHSVSHNAPGRRKQPKIVPNILSRSKNPAWSSSSEASEAVASNNLLHLVQPPHHQLIPAGSSPLVFSAESDLIRDQDQPQTLSPVSSKSPAASTDHLSDVQPGGPPALDTRSDPNSKNLSSLLNEISFLNQQTVATETPSPLRQSGVAEEQRPPPEPQPLQLDCEVAGLNGHTETGQQPGPAVDSTKEGVLAPPPLLHMKVGGVKVPSLPSSEGAAMGGVGGGGRGSRGVAWRPMPRLVPLGLRGNSPS
ncbi:MAX dimerization protein MGA a isoform X4 [Leuresthes tenuis]|uniref:MAX dimerization protein MGA a isoform X4 n=1 Tax=Leuresthes tenuis TaxID=355514 RepID=UPI003B507289